ncbi:DedA protein [hydrothermal vent metagenome]|uniref:DedA protein n=1 Tax=hydrothermal vent metagenome TaxID=652676 RepID=A0A3B1C722_9ZZZZ
MFANSLNELLMWLQQHPLLALLFVFLVAFSESLIVIGLILPGAAFMVGFGALIALGALSAGPAVVAAILGAIAGDSLSYWLGEHYKQALKIRWPFSAYPGLMDRGEDFFHRHGGKSVMLGRFVGPLRPIVPAIAGMLGMPRSRFLLINIVSACLWAPLYLLPGYLFGLSVNLASEFAGRFLLLLALVAGVIWFVVFILRQLFLWLVPYTDRLFYRLLLWSQRHPLAGEIPAAIVNPEHHEVRGLSLLALLLLASSGLLVFLYETIHVPLFSNLGLLIQNAVLELHNPPFEMIMSALARLADPTPALLSASITLFWLLLNRHRQHKLIIGHLLAVPVFPILLMLLPIGPSRLFSPAAIMSLSLYGFLLIALARDIPARWRLRFYASGASLIMLLMFARFYLAQITLFQLFAELSLSTIWISALGIAYRRHNLAYKPTRTPYRLLAVLLLVLGFYPVIHESPSSPQAATVEHYSKIKKEDWLRQGWKTLPRYRHDLRDQYRFPMNLQWAGSLSYIQKQLSKQDWQRVQRKPGRYLNWLKSDAPVIQLPIPPHVHEGRYESLAMVKYIDAGEQILIIRLWPTTIHISSTKNNDKPLWLGSISRLEPITHFGIRYLQTAKNVNLDPQLTKLGKHYQAIIKHRTRINADNGTVLLLSEL